MKICRKCGTANEDSDRFCSNCGAPLDADSCSSGRYYDRKPGEAGQPDTGEEIIYTSAHKRSIPLCIIFTLITCGIYGLYWVYKLNEDINDMVRDRSAAGGVMVILLTIITCNIYGWYWLYKMGEKCNRIRQDNGNSHIVYMLLGIFGLSIVSYALMQDTINSALE